MSRVSNKLDNDIRELNIDENICLILNSNNIYLINDLWLLKRKDLKQIGLSDKEINQIIIKMQLMGIDLNRKVYTKI